MRRAVLLSVKPKWCAKIISGEKTVELRKTVPTERVPFKVYVYCSRGAEMLVMNRMQNEVRLTKELNADNEILLNGCVIGEFLCDEIRDIGFTPWNHGEYDCKDKTYISQSCVGFDEMYRYFGEDYGFGWHISEFKLYDKPLELSEFWDADKCPYNDGDKCNYKYHCFNTGKIKRCGERVKKAPQSWRYVAALGNE